ncbi:hypothetical protein ACHAXS_007832 [Conticribra weissflogii]
MTTHWQLSQCFVYFFRRRTINNIDHYLIELVKDMKFPTASALLLHQYLLSPAVAFVTTLRRPGEWNKFSLDTAKDGSSSQRSIGWKDRSQLFYRDHLVDQIEDVNASKNVFRSLKQDDIQVEENRLYEPLDEDSVIIMAARLSCGDANRNDIDQDILDDCKATTTCEGYLISKNDSNHFEAHLCFNGDNDNDDNIDAFLAVFNKVLKCFLEIEHDSYIAERDETDIALIKPASLAVLLSGTSIDSRSNQLERLGIASNIDSFEDMNLGIDLSKFLSTLNDFAFRNRGTDHGNVSLQLLKMLSSRRVPFDFQAIDDTSHISKSEPTSFAGRRNIISHQKQILPPSTVDRVMNIMDEIKSRQWLSTNPDSVDGLPSLHLNLITDGRPLFEDDGNNDSNDSDTTFPNFIVEMIDVIRPHLYGELLESVRNITNSSTVEISDVFVRNYGVFDIDSNESSGDIGKKRRFGLSPHYDVTAYATCVITLDSTASTGRNGLYTIPPVNGKINNNAALKRFFPMERGDGVVHTYDVLHGVDVDPDLNKPRTSLIVWFVDHSSCDLDSGDGESDTHRGVNRPWLDNPIDEKGEFILGLAHESHNADEMNGNVSNIKTGSASPLELYISSASKGNIFSMTRLGQMCSDDDLLPEWAIQNIAEIARNLEIPSAFANEVKNSPDEHVSSMAYSNALLAHAGIHGGSRIAQISLAENLMVKYITEKDLLTLDEEDDILLMASTLYTMAFNQGHDCMDSMQRLMDVVCERLYGMGFEIPSDEFFRIPVVQMLLLSLE